LKASGRFAETKGNHDEIFPYPHQPVRAEEMTVQSRLAGFHGGELAVQRQARVEAEAARLAPMVARGELRAGMAAFISEATFAAMTARDRTGRL